MDDPLDRPEYLAQDIELRRGYGEESVRESDERANEMHDLADLF